jgi:hypothetical protein
MPPRKLDMMYSNEKEPGPRRLAARESWLSLGEPVESAPAANSSRFRAVADRLLRILIAMLMTRTLFDCSKARMREVDVLSEKIA